ncbi:MAG TPA: hypothetical protein VGE34_03845 [Candidatus Saccharimonadales bacterium]
MGLFTKKQSIDEEMAERERQFLDQNFKEELRNHARLYFQNVLKENGQHFREELSRTIADVNTELKSHIIARLDGAIDEIKVELKDHVSKQVEAQLAQQAGAMKEVQDKALADITQSAQNLESRHKELAGEFEKSLVSHEQTLDGVFEDSKAQMNKMKDSHQLALQWFSESLKSLQAQHEQLESSLKEQVNAQKDVMLKSFEDNMARVIEHYLLEALGDQLDLKAQLPSIIKQLETNKQAIQDDMKL